MSEMEKAETIERWTEGLKRAISRCRELGKAQGKESDWNKVATQLEMLKVNGDKLMAGKALTRPQIELITEARLKELGMRLN